MTLTEISAIVRNLTCGETRMKSLIFTAALICAHCPVLAKPICRVHKVSSAPGGLLIQFAGNVEFDVVTQVGPEEKGDAAKYEFKSGSTTSNGKPTAGVFVGLGAAAYLSVGFTESCVLRAIDPEDHRKGVLVEEYLHAPRQAPSLKSEFITADE